MPARVRKLVAVADLSRAARVLEGQAHVLSYDDSLAQTVSSLFPESDVDLLPEFRALLDRPELARFRIDLTLRESDLEDLLRTSRRKRCPGPSGLRTELLQAMSQPRQGASEDPQQVVPGRTGCVCLMGTSSTSTALLANETGPPADPPASAADRYGGEPAEVSQEVAMPALALHTSTELQCWKRCTSLVRCLLRKLVHFSVVRSPGIGSPSS